MPAEPRRFRRWLGSKRGRSEEATPPPSSAVEAEAVSGATAPEPEPKAVVNERSARALLASGTPPLPPEPQKLVRRRRLERRPAPTPPEPQAPVATGATPQEWNIWELQRAVRGADDQDRQEEWSALFIHLREFANSEGTLPVEFDELVRESFAGVLERRPETAAS